MRGACLSIVLVAVLGGLGAAACGDASTSKITPKGAGAESSSSSGGRGDDEDLQAADSGPIDPGTDPLTIDPNDEDGDGVPNADDCDPKSKSLGRKLAEDTLQTDQALFAAPAGFPAASWSFDNGYGYRQTRLVEGSDTVFYSKDANIGDVQVELTMASTAVSTTITPILRQIFVVVGATANAGSLSAHACGIEVADTENPTQKTSVVKLDGATTAVATQVLQRVTRPAVQLNEDLTVKMRFEGGVLVCTVTQAGAVVTTASANIGAQTGSIGLFTRQTKALFKNIRVCALK